MMNKLKKNPLKILHLEWPVRFHHQLFLRHQYLANLNDSSELMWDSYVRGDNNP